ncbi:Smr/MutS family protein [Roseococcus sp. YIM B11640]|uniref:Smr/MutS family protein n=1 Tax=Roseococcus sp. YIM B11640 TaxID=3133973 RepID=UPI003C7C613F
MRRRGLSAEDQALWAAVARSIRPLPGRKLPELADVPEAMPVPERAPAPAPAKPVARARLPAAEVAVGTQPSGLDARRWRDLRRGDMRPERKLDLHGMTAARAHQEVERFLRASQAEGLRVVCIVTGKGSHTEGGILRRELPHWLNAPGLRPLILAAAHPHKANAGAVHLLLRRAR